MHFKIYEDHRGEWRWKLKAKNGRIVADSGEGYKSERNVRRAIDKLIADLDPQNFVEVRK